MTITRDEVYAAVRADNDVRECVDAMAKLCVGYHELLYDLAAVAFLAGRISVRHETISELDTMAALTKAAR